MNAIRLTSIRSASGLAAMLGVLAVAGCVPPPQAPQVTQSSNPTVTYKYRGDQEILTANQNALVFCAQYNASTTVGTITDNADGSRNAVFQCVPNQAGIAQPVMTTYNPNTFYVYRNDQTLLAPSPSAETYCMSNGGMRALQNVQQNANGTRTITYQCVPR